MDLGPVGFGVFSIGPAAPHIGVRFGDVVVDMAAATGDPLFIAPSLNPLLVLGRLAWESMLALAETAAARHHIPLEEVTPQLPFEVADYVDFYSSRAHAEAAGRILRPGEDPLPRQWLDVPIGYHGRAGTVVVSGTPIIRPSGQLGPGAFGPTEKLDIEAEVGWVVGVPSARPVRTAAFRDHVFGAVLVNDWSARDIQAWEARPLGPFLGKSFATSISAWVTPLSALPRVEGPPFDHEPLPYLRVSEPRGFDLRLAVEINGEVVSRPPFSEMYWSPAQQLSHMTVNGATLRTGDLFASGTVSGPRDPGSLLELTRDGRYLRDGDRVTISCDVLSPVEGVVVGA